MFRNLDDLRLEQVAEEYCVIIDAVFGFSFDANREIRGPYDKMIQLMVRRLLRVVPRRVDRPFIAVLSDLSLPTSTD